MKDANGDDITIEETIDENGNIQIKKIKMRYDKDGNQIIVEEYTDEHGNVMVRTKKINKDGSIETEEVNKTTGERKIFK